MLEIGWRFGFCSTDQDGVGESGEVFLQIQAAFAEMERNIIHQRVKEGIAAARARGRKGGRPRIMTAEKLQYAEYLMQDQTKSIPAICRELGDIPSSTLYHYVTAKGELKKAGVDLISKID